MSFEAQCPQCMCVSRQLMQPTRCLLHVAAFEAEQGAVTTLSHSYDEPYEFGQPLTVDRTGPFTLREYVSLRLLRSRLEAGPRRV